MQPLNEIQKEKILLILFMHAVSYLKYKFMEKSFYFNKKLILILI